jgi:hypothetical protein
LTLAKNLTLLTLPDSQRISVRTKRQFTSDSPIGKSRPIPANKISRDQTVQFAPSDARAAFQFVPFGRSVSVTNCDWEKRKSRVQLVCNEHLHKKGGGYPHPHSRLLNPDRWSPRKGAPISKALRGFAYASRVLREVIGSASSPPLWRQSSEQHRPNSRRMGSAR